jgi:hypothetical protein
MRRLFSTFADGAPGAGLLLLRAAAAAGLIAPAIHVAMGEASALGVVGSLLCAAAGVLLAVGLWTPIAAVFGTLLALAQAVGVPGRTCSELSLAAITAALGLLGPGAWSLDARLFGWKRIEIAPRKSPDSSLD